MRQREAGGGRVGHFNNDKRRGCKERTRVFVFCLVLCGLFSFLSFSRGMGAAAAGNPFPAACRRDPKNSAPGAFCWPPFIRTHTLLSFWFLLLPLCLRLLCVLVTVSDPRTVTNDCFGSDCVCLTRITTVALTPNPTPAAAKCCGWLAAAMLDSYQCDVCAPLSLLSLSLSRPPKNAVSPQPPVGTKHTPCFASTTATRPNVCASFSFVAADCASLRSIRSLPSSSSAFGCCVTSAGCCCFTLCSLLSSAKAPAGAGPGLSSFNFM